MAKLDELFEKYKDVTKEKLWANFKYFLEAILPTCHECDIKMAVHMDDSPWDIFGLPRLFTDAAAIDYFLDMVDTPYNCLTLCSGSLNANPDNDVASIVCKHADRIAFAHIRNLSTSPTATSPRPPTGTAAATQASWTSWRRTTTRAGTGYIRPDHGRHLWDEVPGKVRPGYGLYDRVLGIQYMLGVWDALDKFDKIGDCESRVI